MQATKVIPYHYIDLTCNFFILSQQLFIFLLCLYWLGLMWLEIYLLALMFIFINHEAYFSAFGRLSCGVKQCSKRNYFGTSAVQQAVSLAILSWKMRHTDHFLMLKKLQYEQNVFAKAIITNQPCLYNKKEIMQTG